MKINISTIIEAIEMADDNFTFFLDLETGKSVLLADELSTGMDNEGLENEIEDNPERFFRLPTKFEIHEYNIMEEFIQTLKGEDADKLEQVIQGRGAFRRFKDMVNRRGIFKGKRHCITNCTQCKYKFRSGSHHRAYALSLSQYYKK